MTKMGALSCLYHLAQGAAGSKPPTSSHWVLARIPWHHLELLLQAICLIFVLFRTNIDRRGPLAIAWSF